jgi:hypothetical protein
VLDRLGVPVDTAGKNTSSPFQSNACFVSSFGRKFPSFISIASVSIYLFLSLGIFLWRVPAACSCTMAVYNSDDIGPLGGGMNKQTAQESRANAPIFDGEDGSEEYHESLRGYTRADRADMSRMGKVQELKRNYRPLSALAFTVILQGTWEVLLT